MRGFAFAAVAAVLCVFGTAAVAQNSTKGVRQDAARPAVSIQFSEGQFRVAGWRAPNAAPAGGWPSVFAVYAGPTGAPPMAGSYAVQNGVLVFHPGFSTAPGVTYRAVFSPSGAAAIEQTFSGPRRDLTPVARVEQVYPSGGVLPSNQLRLYVYFSRPMSRGEAAKYVHVVDSAGKHLEGPRGLFLPGEELWDPGLDRLTLTFDPGRIKRGLTSNMAVGPPIVEGRTYRLLIDRDWPDAQGAPMVRGFEKSFRGGPALRSPPDPKQWRVLAPRAASTGDLVVDFPTPMNFPLLQRMIQVSGPRGPVSGTVGVDRNETEWRFTPKSAWTPGDYRLIVDTGIEDLAGNHIGQPFDIDTFEHVTAHIATSTVAIPFAVR